MTNNNININENTNINKRILPIFFTPIIKKIIIEKKKSKFNLNILKKNSQNKLNSSTLSGEKFITESQIIELFLKGITKYNKNLNDYASKWNNLELILNLKKDEFYKSNLRVSNLLYCIKRFFPIFKIRNILKKVEIFLPKNLLKPNPKIRYSYRFKHIAKFYKYPNILKENNMLDNIMHWDLFRDLNRLFKICQEENTNLDYLIYKKKNILEKIKVNNLIAFQKQSKDIITGIGNGTDNSKAIKTNKNNNNFYELLLENTKNKLTQNRTILSKIKSNQIKIEQTIKSITTINKFNCKTDPIPVNSNPISIFYNDLNKNPILNQYLKSMSIYNMKNKGIFIIYSNIIGFNFNTDTNKLIKNVYNLLAASFKSMYCLISKPVFVITPDKIIIQLFYYLIIPNILKLKKIYRKEYKYRYNFRSVNKTDRLHKQFGLFKNKVKIKFKILSKFNLTKFYPDKFRKLCDILSHLFKKPVELDLIRLHYPYNDSNILVNLLGIMINKIKVRIIIRKLFRKAVIKNLNKITRKTKVNVIPSFLSGLTIRIAGRLLTHRVIPRQTIKITRRGASARGKINFSDVARITKKNKRGAFSITVSGGQNYF
jgi:hypothetical protein